MCEHCFIADDGLMSVVWCKRRFQRRRSNFDGKFIHFTSYGAKKLSEEYLSKGWGVRGLNKLFKKLKDTDTTAR